MKQKSVVLVLISMKGKKKHEKNSPKGSIIDVITASRYFVEKLKEEINLHRE